MLKRRHTLPQSSEKWRNLTSAVSFGFLERLRGVGILINMTVRTP